MRIIIISQNEPFFLKNNLKYLFSILPKNINVVGCVIDKASPFGKKESFFSKSIKTLNIFGLKFFIYYSLKFLFSKLFNKSVRQLIKSSGIEEIKLNSSVNSTESIEKIKSYKPDLIVSVLGRQIFKRKFINLAPKGLINLHTALLPKYRGLMPSFWVLKNNEKYTGVSVFFVDEGIDSGPIIIQEKIEIGNMSQADLIKKSKKIGMEVIARAIKLIDNNNYQTLENNNDEMTYFSFPTKEDVNHFKKIGKKFY